MTGKVTTTIILLFCSFNFGNCLSTEELEKIFIGRCEYFQRVHRREIFPQKKVIDCDMFWEKFSMAKNGKGSCSFEMSDYKNVTDYVKNAIPKKNRLLWSQLYSFVAKVSRAGYFFTISDSLIGYPLDNTYWCSKNSTGQPCPCGGCSQQKYLDRTYENCRHDNEATSSFWDQASYLFASTAEDKITVMLNSTSWGMQNGKKIPFYPYYSKTIFGRIELPSLTRDKIKTLEVVLVAKPGQAVTETCKGDKSLYHIKNILKTKGIDYKCIMNPPYVVSLFKNQESTNKSSHQSTFKGLFIFLSILSTVYQRIY